MQNYAETTWAACKAGIFPTATGEEEKRLKLAFLQGLHSGQSLTIQSSELESREFLEFSHNLRDQKSGSLSQLGHRPGRISIGSRIHLPPGINGES
jgi:hypothetical protein